MENCVTLNAVNLVFSPLRLDGLKIREVALTAFYRGQRLYLRVVRGCRIYLRDRSPRENQTHHNNKTNNNSGRISGDHHKNTSALH